MHRTTSLALRGVFLLGFLIALPVIALPGVARFVDQTLYGKPSPAIPAIEPQKHTLHVIEPHLAERSSPAQFDGPGLTENSARQRSGLEGLDALAASPPPLAPLPSFPESTATVTLGSPAASPADPKEEMISQVQRIRERLEVLGAKYILLETADDSGKFRFHCQMLLDESSAQTRDFEALATDPTVAASAVLQEVETWRTAGRPATTRIE